MSLCQPCAGLSFQHLVHLAKKEFTVHLAAFPKSAFYAHHASFDELEQSAISGCDLCRLILDLSKSYNATDWNLEWQPDTCDIKSSMYTAAKALEVSDVKIALTSSYFYLNYMADVDEPRIYDGLRVQVGPSEEDAESGDGWWIPVLPLKLSVPCRTPVYIRGLQIGGFQTDKNLGSSENFDLARHWLKTCRQSHEGCLSGALPVLPTRVIDVGTMGDMLSPRVVHSRGMRDEYTALSHCWGGNITPLLTTTTLAAFGMSLPYDELPANFRDAIAITRELGIRYLWIDSLCILQDSPQDWDSESKKMGDVYGNSTLTISAMASSRSTDGILQQGTSLPDTPRPATLEVPTESGSFVTMTVEREDSDEESLATLERRSPLSSRGWTLQEAVLSPRRLFYGKNRIYWRCSTAFKSAAAAHDLAPGPNTPDNTFPGVSSVFHSGAINPQLRSNRPEGSVVLEDYYRLVQSFSSRTLSFPSDKFPAFSGLAQRLNHAVGGDYLAGLWSSDIKNGLLWKFDAGYCRHLTRPYRAPSWSWAVTDGRVLFDYLEDRPSDPKPFDMQLLEYSITPKDKKNPFGQVEDGYLIVRGFVKGLVRTKQILTCRLPDVPSIGSGTFDEPLVDGTPDELKANLEKHFSITNLHQIKNKSGDDWLLAISGAVGQLAEQDTFKVSKSDFFEEECLALLVRSYPLEPGIDDESEGYPNSSVQCLALRRVAGRSGNVYERIGQLDMRESDHEWLQSWKSQTLTII